VPNAVPVLVTVKRELVPSVTAALLLIVNVTPLQVGALSLSLIVAVALAGVPRTPPLAGAESVIVNVSGLSTIESSLVATLTVWVAWADVNVSVPDFAV
jgi:hypothetical protein